MGKIDFFFPIYRSKFSQKTRFYYIIALKITFFFKKLETRKVFFFAP